jgi:short-subunit dehydrogenase
MSSVAAVIPAPTRSLYGSSKTAFLLLYQALSIKHPDVRFTSILSGTVEGDFCGGAADGPGGVRESLIGVLAKVDVAKACVDAVDRRLRNVFLPKYMRSVGSSLITIVPVLSVHSFSSFL